MYKFKFILIIFSLALLNNLSCFSDNEPVYLFSQKKSNAKMAHMRVMVAPVISFYQVNKHHAANPHQKMSGLASIKEEFCLNYKHTLFFAIGAEYFVHGLNFNSYYFKPDSIQLYNGNMDYTYSLYMHEIDIPLQLKLSFNHENNALISPYIMFGYHYRTILVGNLKVKQNGELVDKQKEHITFKNPLFGVQSNPFVSITFGVQKNNPTNSKKSVFGEITYRYGFSPYLLSDKFTPSSLYISGNHLSIGFGIRF